LCRRCWQPGNGLKCLFELHDVVSFSVLGRGSNIESRNVLFLSQARFKSYLLMGVFVVVEVCAGHKVGDSLLVVTFGNSVVATKTDLHLPCQRVGCYDILFTTSRIHEGSWLVICITVQITVACRKAQGILSDPPSDARVVEPGPVVLKPRLGISF